MPDGRSEFDQGIAKFETPGRACRQAVPECPVFAHSGRLVSTLGLNRSRGRSGECAAGGRWAERGTRRPGPVSKSWGSTPWETGVFAMSDKPISPLRQRMIDDMTARRFKEKVQKDYVRHVRTFAALLGRSPDTATSEDLRRYQLHLAKQQISPGSINAAIAALRFFFTVTLEPPDLVRPLTIVNKPRKA